MAAEVNFACMTCGDGIVLPLEGTPSPTHCARCGKPAALLAAAGDAEAPKPAGPLARCAVCGAGALFVQRDFSRKLGIAVVALAALFAVPTWGISLAVAVLVDAVLHRILPRITVCYACDAIHRGVPVNPAHGAFDHHVADGFKVEKAKRALAVRRWRRDHGKV
jgi:hypothetical protein